MIIMVTQQLLVAKLFPLTELTKYVTLLICMHCFDQTIFICEIIADTMIHQKNNNPQTQIWNIISWLVHFKYTT